MCINNKMDNDTDTIRNVCESLIGAEMRMNCEITLRNGHKSDISMVNTNIIGDCLEDLLYPFISAKLPNFKHGEKQKSPDFYNGEFEWELKTFTKQANFDIGNFTSYIDQLADDDGIMRKLYQTQYLIFEYEYITNMKKFTIKDFHICNVCNLVSYSGKYPLSMQVKKGMWYNLRPVSSMRAIKYSVATPALFIANIIRCVNMCPNATFTDSYKKRIVNSIQTQCAVLNIK